MQAVLGSWKEIASYLGKGVRTVQRWERHSGLPVHRPSGSSKGVVLAFPAELDHWARRQDLRSVTIPTRLTIQRNTALSNELASHSRALRESTAELMKSCAHFLELSRQRNGARRSPDDLSARRKAV
jgi:hypothetical protein